jgi:hypothetical protein
MTAINPPIYEAGSLAMAVTITSLLAITGAVAVALVLAVRCPAERIPDLAKALGRWWRR